MGKKKLRTETNTPEMGERIEWDALEALEDHAGDEERNPFRAFFEHGQWWVENIHTGAQWSVNDAETQTGHKYFDYEQVTQGDED